MKSDDHPRKGETAWGKLAAAGRSMGKLASEAAKTAKSLANVAVEATAKAAAILEFASHHGVDMEWLRTALRQGRITIPETVINECLGKALEKSDEKDLGGFTFSHVIEIESIEPKKGCVEVRVKKGMLADAFVSAYDSWKRIKANPEK